MSYKFKKIIFLQLLLFFSHYQAFTKEPKAEKMSRNEELNTKIKNIAHKKPHILLEAREKNGKLIYFKKEGKFIKKIKIKMINKKIIPSWHDLKSKYINLIDTKSSREKFLFDLKEVLKDYAYTNPLIKLKTSETQDSVTYFADIQKNLPCRISKIEKNFKNSSEITLNIKEGDLCNINTIKKEIISFTEELKENNYHRAIINFSKIEYSKDKKNAVVYISGHLGSSFSYKLVETEKSGLLSKFLWFSYTEHPLDNLKNKYTTKQSVFYKIKEFYLGHGFYDVHIEKPIEETNKKGHLSIIYKVTPGNYYALGNIQFVGNKSFTKKRLLDLSKDSYTLNKKASYNEKDLDDYIEKLHAFYFSMGYWNTKVQRINLPDKKNKKISINIHIKEGKQHILNKIILKDNKLLSREDLLSESLLKTKKPLNPDEIQKLENTIKEKYKKKSFLSTSVNISFIQKKTSQNQEVIDLILTIDEGKLYRIDKILILGLESMSPDFIRHFLEFKEGDPYSLDKIEKSRQQLLDLGVFTSVTFPKRENQNFKSKEKLVTVYVELRESHKGDVTFGPGYDFKSGFLYNLDIFYKNPFGKAHKFLLNTSISEEKNQPFITPNTPDKKKSHRLGTSIGLNHYNPFFFHKNISEEIHILYRRGSFQDEESSLWVTTKDFKLQFEYSLSFLLKKSALFTHYHFLQSTEEGESNSRISLLSIPNTTYSIFGLGLRLDYRDSKPLPKKGFLAEIGLDFATTLFFGDYDYLKSKFLFSYYYNIWANYVFAFHYSEESYLYVKRKHSSIDENFIPRAQRLFISTADKVRGFKEDLGPYSWKIGEDKTRRALHGTHSVLYKLELRAYKIYSLFGLTLFLDGGNTFFSEKESEDIKKFYFQQHKINAKNNYEAKDMSIRPSFTTIFKSPVDFIANQYHSVGLSVNIALPIGILNISIAYPISEPKDSTWSRIDKEKPLNNIKFDLNIGTFF